MTLRPRPPSPEEVRDARRRRAEGLSNGTIMVQDSSDIRLLSDYYQSIEDSRVTGLLDGSITTWRESDFQLLLNHYRSTGAIAADQDEESDDDDALLTPSAPPPGFTPGTLLVEEDEDCCFCRTEMNDGHTYYRPPCGHLYCGDCIKDDRLSTCMRCNQDFVMYNPVHVRVVIDTDKDMDTDN